MTKTVARDRIARPRQTRRGPQGNPWGQWLLLLIILGLLGGAAFWGYKRFFPDDEIMVRRRLNELAQAASFGASEKPLSSLAGASGLAGFFTPDVLIKVHGIGGEEGGFRGRERVQELALAARRETQFLSVQFLTPEVIVDRPAGTAIVQTTVRAQTGGQSEPFLQLLKLDWQKTEGKWLVSRVATVEALRRLPASPEP